MAKQTQLELIRELAQSREHELAAEVGELRRLQQDAETALHRLNGYLSEYTVGKRLSGTLTDRGIAQLENERRFVIRLQQAVEQQHLHVSRFAERVNIKIQFWQRERSQLEALDKIVDQRRMTAGRIHERREQSEVDEISGRAIAFKKCLRERG